MPLEGRGLGWGWVNMEMVSKKITHPPPDLPLEEGGTAVQFANRTILVAINVSTSCCNPYKG